MNFPAPHVDGIRRSWHGNFGILFSACVTAFRELVLGGANDQIESGMKIRIPCQIPRLRQWRRNFSQVVVHAVHRMLENFKAGLAWQHRFWEA